MAKISPDDPPRYRISGRGVKTGPPYSVLTRRAVVHGDTDGRLLMSRYPECKETYVNRCAFDEVQQPCSNLCWRICPIHEYFDEAAQTCRTIPGVMGVYWTTNEKATSGCRAFHKDYRLPTMEEFTELLGGCTLADRGRFMNITCDPYLDSAAYYVIDSGAWMVDFPVDPPARCTNRMGATNYGCAWIGRLYAGTNVARGAFNLLYYHGGPASTVTSAYCVREQKEGDN